VRIAHAPPRERQKRHCGARVSGTRRKRTSRIGRWRGGSNREGIGVGNPNAISDFSGQNRSVNWAGQGCGGGGWQDDGAEGEGFDAVGDSRMGRLGMTDGDRGAADGGRMWLAAPIRGPKA